MRDTGASVTISQKGKGRCFDIVKNSAQTANEERVQIEISIDKLMEILKSSRANHSYVEMGFDAMPTVAHTQHIYSRL